MRLRKRVGVALLAASMAFTMVTVNLQDMVKAALAEPEAEAVSAGTVTGDTENAVGEVLSETESTKLNLEEMEELSKAEDAQLKTEIESTKAEPTIIDMAEPEEEAEAGIEALADAEESDITISDMTIADTYYSVNGKFPLYVEYQTTEELTYSQRSNLKLKVTKEDGTIVVPETESESYNNCFSAAECENIKSGDKTLLTFAIIDSSNAGTEKELKSVTKTVTFEAQNNWANRKYLPTEERDYSITLYLTEEETMPAVGSGSVDGLYLMDSDNKIAAGTKDKDSIYSWSVEQDYRYEGIFENTVSIRAFYISGTVYRTRKLKNNEILHAAYSVNGEMHDLKDITFTMTEKPYITELYRSSDNKYPGQEDSDILRVNGRHIDFDKLSVVLRDKKTGAIAGSSVDAMTKIYYRNSAYISIKWEEGYQPIQDRYVSYNVEYNYSDKETEVIAEMGRTISYGNNNSDSILWNPKSDSIEYYNKKIPTGISVSYEVQEGSNLVTSGRASADDTHLIKIPLKETFGHNGYYNLSITYTDSDQNETTVNKEVYIYANKTMQGEDPTLGDEYIIYQYVNNDRYYLSNNEKPAFSAGFYCNDVSKLAATCNAVIYNRNTNQEAGNMELILNNNNGLTYRGIHDGALAPGRYQLSFQPDGNVTFIYYLYVEDSSRLSVTSQSNAIVSGEVELYFASSDIADWYCNEENQKKLSIKLFDIQKKEIGTYQLGIDFTVAKSNSHNRSIQFNDTIKKELADRYFCYVYIYYGEEEIAISFYNNSDSSIKSLYEYSSGEAEYIYSESRSYIYMSYQSYNYNKGKTTYDYVYGSQSAFPAVVKVTDWHNLKTVKEISVPSSNYKFTEDDLKGLSATKVYRFYVNGADGSANDYLGYIKRSYGDSFWTSFSDFYPVSGDFDVTFEFTNKSSGEKNNENYLVCFANAFEVTSPRPNDNAGYKEYYILRSDAWGWSVNDKGENIENKTLEGNEVTYNFDWEWDQFCNLMKDSKITMNIKRTGNDFVVDAKIKGADGKDYTYKTMFTTNADKDMTIFFTNDRADVTILNFQNNTKKKPEISDDNNNNNNSGTVITPPASTGTTSTGTTTEPVKNEPEKEEPKQEEPENPEDNKNTEPEKPPVKEPDNNNNENNNTTKVKGKLTLKKKKITLKKGQKATIKITSQLNTKVTYKSLNKSVATVNKKGVVTAKKAGKATITVKANGKTKKVTVTVKGTTGKDTKDSSVIKLGKNLKLSKTKVVLIKGNKLTIQASDSSDKVTYRSLNKKIASVSVNGVVKAKKKGKTAIVIKTKKKTVKLNVAVKR